jgi:nucleotide-binding universal stress UspA family protein
MSAPGVGRHEVHPDDGRRPIERLLFIADAAVADVDELPPTVRAMIDASADVYVVTPTLPGRLAWLADDVDHFRSVADERLDAVLRHLRSIGIDARGVAARGSVALVIADAIAEFEPDHVLIALGRPERANWQEHRLIERIEQRSRLPVMSYAVDRRGSSRTGEGPLLLCYDGSGGAGHAIVGAGRLFGGRPALVVTVWHPTALGSLAWSGATASMDRFVDDDRTAAELGAQVAEEGVRIARAAGLEAEPLSAEGGRPVWATILGIAERVDAATIVMGPRGLRARWPMLMGSVSSAVVHHTDRPTLLIPQPVEHELRR